MAHYNSTSIEVWLKKLNSPTSLINNWVMCEFTMWYRIKAKPLCGLIGPHKFRIDIGIDIWNNHYYSALTIRSRERCIDCHATWVNPPWPHQASGGAYQTYGDVGSTLNNSSTFYIGHLLLFYLSSYEFLSQGLIRHHHKQQTPVLNRKITVCIAKDNSKENHSWASCALVWV